MRKLIIFALVVAVGLFAASANAKTISINFETGNYPLAAGDVAGIVPADDWNNVSTSSGSGLVLNDSDGNPTAVTLDHSARGNFTDNPSTGGSAADQTMMNSGWMSIGPQNYPRETGQVMLQGLATEFSLGYDVYVYFGDVDWTWGWPNGGFIYESNTAADYTASVSDPAMPTGNETQTLTWSMSEGQTFSGTWTPGTNYVLFTGKSADVAVYTAWVDGTINVGGNFCTALINGMQIDGPDPVIPEPAGLGLLGVALLAMRRRRS